MICPNCGTEIETNSETLIIQTEKACQECGHAITNE